MKPIVLCFSYGLLSLFFLSACMSPATEYQTTSPDGVLKVVFRLSEAGRPTYQLFHKGQIVIDTSALGFELKDMPPLAEGFRVVKVETGGLDQTWEMPWGEQRMVRNHYNQLRIELKETNEPGRLLSLCFRVFNDGMGFRYELPAQPGLSGLTITDELTEFALTGNHTCWWQPGDWDIYEHLYNETPFTEIDATTKRDHPNLAQTYIPENAVNTPVTMKTAAGLYLSFHEAALYDYSDMTLKIDAARLKMTSELVGRPDGAKADVKLPFHTPWRTVQVATRAGDLIESKLVLNLNEPNLLEDIGEWFRPMKYVGIWWEMHLGKSSWDMASGKHGATTQNAKRYIDFAAANNIRGLLIEGWNTGWERWIGFPDREGVFDFVTSYADYDLAEVVRYAKEKGVELVMHHETSAAPRTYEQQLDTALRLMERYGIGSVKTGYVGKIIPEGEYHHGQWMVRHYQKVIETAARYKVAVNAHEPIKDTGIRRTWPNFISREGLRGQEFNAWASDGGNPPNHLPTVVFTRMLAGPIDYTPGIFNIKLNPYKPENQVNTTLAQQLALYVVIYGPVQMAADLPEHYEGQPAFQFIRDVGVDWEQTKVLDGEPGDFVVIARQERNTEKWFLGAITDENARTLEVSLGFLPTGRKYRLTLYADDPAAHWNDRPEAISISELEVDSSTTLQLMLAPGGGVAASLFPL